MKKNTYTRAYEACETFFQDTGVMPTIDAIKPIIGVNSPSIISSAIKDWKQALALSIKKTPLTKTEVPSVLVEAVTEIWQEALAQAISATQEKENAIQQQHMALAAKEFALTTESERIQQLVQMTEQKYQEEIYYLKKEMDRLLSETTDASDKAERFRESASTAEMRNAVLTEAIRQEEIKYERLETQFEKQHEWALLRIEEEKDQYRKQVNDEMGRLKSETARSYQDAELQQAKVILMEKQALESRDRLVSLERELSAEKMKIAGMLLNEAKYQNRINELEERIRLLMSKAQKETHRIKALKRQS